MEVSGPMRGQMFIVTVVFLVGMLFVVQQLMFQYASVDPKGGFMTSEHSLLKSVEDSIRDAISGEGCERTRENMEMLDWFLSSRPLASGLLIDLEYTVECTTPEHVDATVKLLGSGMDIRSRKEYYG